MFGVHPCSSAISSFVPGLDLLILWTTSVQWHEADGHLGIPEKRIDHKCVGGDGDQWKSVDLFVT